MRTRIVVTCLGVVALVATACGSTSKAGSSTHGSGSTAPGATQSQVRNGGALTVAAIGSQWPGLDPATGTQVSADYDYMNAIFGQLFIPGANGKIVPDLATGYHFSPDGLTLTVGIRQGVTFQDGTPFTAQAVQSSIERDLDPKNACSCAADFAAVQSITTSGDHTLVLHLSSPDYALVDAWADDEAPNWTASPTALAKEGPQQFNLHPVGAGPFEVVSNQPSQKLVLKAFPGYWEKGKPHLDSLTFLSIANEATAYDALQSKQVQAVTNFSSYQTLARARKDSALHVVTIPGLHSLVVQLNTTVAPFDNKLAREALYYATNSAAYLHVIGGDQGTLSESPTGPGGLFFEKHVPGYRTYDLAKAKALVKQLGGISFTYGVGNTAEAETQGAALQSMWRAAGMDVKLDLETFADIVAGYKHNSWQASAEAEGSYDPSIGTSGLSVRFSSKGFLSGVRNPALDQLIGQAIRVADPTQRKAVYDHIFQIIATEAYGPYLYAPSGSFVTSTSVAAVHPATMASFGPLIEWQDVGLAK